MNNLGGAVSGVAGIAGATLGGVIGSVLFSFFGTLFGAVGAFLGARAAIRSIAKERELRRLVPALSSSKAKEIAVYAAEQKEKKTERQAGVAAAGGLATAAGIAGALTIPAVAGMIGLAAATATVATLGGAAAIAGVLAAVIGLGVVAWRWHHRKKKREKALDELVDKVMAEAQADPPDVDSLRAVVAANGDRKQLRAWAEIRLSVVREDIAKSTISLLVAGKPSDQLDAEAILKGLGVSAEAMGAKVAAGDAASAVSTVAGNLASW